MTVPGNFLMEAAAGSGTYTPFLPGLILLLPLLGFLANGVLALQAGIRGAEVIRSGGSEGAGGHAAGHGEAAAPATHTLPTWIGPGVMLLAFLITLVNFIGMFGAGAGDPVVVSYWTWMATGTLTVDAAIQLDPLSMVMMLIITGVGFLIHVFSVGYMKEDPGYPRYFAYLNLFVFHRSVCVQSRNSSCPGRPFRTYVERPSLRAPAESASCTL